MPRPDGRENPNDTGESEKENRSMNPKSVCEQMNAETDGCGNGNVRGSMPGKDNGPETGQQANIRETALQPLVGEKYAEKRRRVVAVIFWMLTLAAPFVHYFTGWLPEPDTLWIDDAAINTSSYVSTVIVYLIGGMIVPGFAFFLVTYGSDFVSQYDFLGFVLCGGISAIAIIVHVIVIIYALINGVLSECLSSVLCLLAFGIVLLDLRDVMDKNRD